jgi:hypothetical protein
MNKKHSGKKSTKLKHETKLKPTPAAIITKPLDPTPTGGCADHSAIKQEDKEEDTAEPGLGIGQGSAHFSDEDKLRYQTAIECGGGIYKGIWPAIPGRSEKLILFNSPETRSTLALVASEVSVENVREKIRESNIQFGMKS